MTFLLDFFGLGRQNPTVFGVWGGKTPLFSGSGRVKYTVFGVWDLKYTVFGVLRCMGPPWGCMGPPWGCMGPPWVYGNPPIGCMGTLPLGAIWCRFVPFYGKFGAILCHFMVNLVPFW